MNLPLVSIVMPAFNAEAFIAQAIESVINQTYSQWELIIVDDASTDATTSIIHNYRLRDTRIRVINKPTNTVRPAIAKNIALANVKGKYIAFLDSDDAWREDKLELQVRYLNKRTDVALLYTGGYWVDENYRIIKKFVPQYPYGDNLKRQLVKYEINNQSVIIITKALADTLNKFNEAITIGEDYNLFMHISALYKTASLKEPLIYYRIHNNSITKRKRQYSDGVLITLKELHNKYGIKVKHPFCYFLTYLKAIRFKYLKKKWA